MKILHLIVDHQVIERTLGIYEAVFPESNDVLVFDWKPRDPIKHLHKYKSCPIVGNGKGMEYGKSFDFKGITHIIAHYLTMDMINFIKSAPSDIHVCWEIYGADLYNQFLVDYDYKLYHTSPKRYGKYSILQTYFNPLFKALLYLKGVKYVYPSQRRKQFEYICNRADSLQYCCEGDGALVCKYGGKELPGYEVFNYSLNEVLGDLKDAEFSRGHDIMIGNSASFSNNHLYVLDLIRKANIPEDSKIIMPLSYGGAPKYIDKVMSRYERVYNDKIYFLKDYLPLHEYNKIFLKIGVMIMSAWRQESIGTIIMGLYLGIKVYMSERSPLYKWLNDCGFKLFTIESLGTGTLKNDLTLEQKQANRDLVNQRYGEQVFTNTLKHKFK